MTWVTSAAVAAKTAVCSSAPVPAVRGLVGVDGDQVGAAADRDLAGVVEAEAGVAGRRGGGEQLGGGPVAALLGGQPLVDLDRAHLLEQVDHRVAVAAEGERAPASCSCRLGPMPSPRSRSVVGQKQALVCVEPRCGCRRR